MPLLRNKYQPYIPDPDSPLSLTCGDEAYCHPISLGDQIMTQFYQTPCAANLIADPDFEDVTLGAELLTNGTFTGSAASWALTGNWVYNSDAIDHTASGAFDTATQTGLAISGGSYYQVQVVATNISAGYCNILLGGGANLAVVSDNGTSTYYVYAQGSNTDIVISTSTDFAGTIDSISLKAITTTDWTTNSNWQLEDGMACALGSTGSLVENVANYITVGGYYKITVTASNVTGGTCEVYVADILVGTISGNGTFTYWTETRPTVTGVVTFTPDTNFDGCLSDPALYELRDDYEAVLISMETGSEYDISSYIEYYQDWVTLIFRISTLELGYGCYYYEVYDSCLTTGNDLVTNGDFSTGDFTGWTRNNGSHQYSINGSNQLEMYFDPLTGETDLVTDGDFASGAFAPNWTAGANWSVVANKARHTAGSTDTLAQTITIGPPPAAPTVEQYWVQFVISNRTAGSVTVTWGNQTSPAFSTDDTYTYPLTPGTSGNVDLTFTPSSDFDGDLDDIVLVASNTIWSASPFITNAVNTDMVAGNYDAAFEIISTTDTDLSATVLLVGQTQSPTYYDTAGTHTESISNYTPGSQQVRVLASFRNGSNFVPGTIIVDNITANRTEPFEATYTSECLNYRLEHTNSRMVIGYCDQESFGFEFENTGFKLQQRIITRSFNPTYPGVPEIMKTGSGDARITYSEIEKYWLLATDYISETAHDALAVIRLCDHFLIGPAEDNGTEYIIDNEDYVAQWRTEGDYTRAIAIFKIRTKEDGQKFNRHT